ncbi:hypothetical protein D3C73_1112250 [compost metagenome]
MFADDNGRAVDIEEQVAVVHRQIFKCKFFDRQIDGCVCNSGVINKEHSEFLRLYMVNFCIYSKLKPRISQNRKHAERMQEGRRTGQNGGRVNCQA